MYYVYNLVCIEVSQTLIGACFILPSPPLTGVSADNPSLDLRSLARRLLYKGQRAVIAIAPAVEDTSSSKPSSAGYSLQNSSPGVPKNGGVDDTVEMGRGHEFGGADDVTAGGEGGNSGPETLAAEAFGSWLVDELGGPRR